jgi:hypothetical protein
MGLTLINVIHLFMLVYLAGLLAKPELHPYFGSWLQERFSDINILLFWQLNASGLTGFVTLPIKSAEESSL